MDEIAERIKNRVGMQVVFRYPDGSKKIGKLKSRVVMASNPDAAGVPYWDVVDLIEFPDDSESEWIRIGYFRKTGNKLVFAGQTTITEPVNIWKKLLIHAAREKPWFRNLLLEAVAEIQQDTER